MLEMLITVLIIASLVLVSVNRRKQPDLERYRFLNDYLLLQSQAIREKRAKAYENGIRFNSMGHIDMARTVSFSSGKITLNLGNGYALIR